MGEEWRVDRTYQGVINPSPPKVVQLDFMLLTLDPAANWPLLERCWKSSKGFAMQDQRCSYFETRTQAA